MLRKLTKKTLQLSFVSVLFAAFLTAPAANAQDKSPTGSDDSEIAGNNAAVNKAEASPPVVTPLFTNYKGVSLGMSADDVRQKLSHLKEKSKTQDFFLFSDNESAQVFYDNDGKVMAVSLNYIGTSGGAPDAKAVLGEEVEAKADGSLYKLVRYPEAGYWVSYSRTAGDSPITTITMQKTP